MFESSKINIGLADVREARDTVLVLIALHDSLARQDEKA